jgi:hypothetical protein
MNRLIRSLFCLFSFFQFTTPFYNLNDYSNNQENKIVKPIYSIKAINLTFNPYSMNGEQRVILHPPSAIVTYNEKESMIDIYDIQSRNYDVSFVSGTLKNITHNMTYKNILSFSLVNQNYTFAVGVRPSPYTLKIDLINKILTLTDPLPDKNNLKIINVFYYEYINNTNIRYPAILNTTRLTLPNTTNTTNTTLPLYPDDYPHPPYEIPEEIKTVTISSSSDDKFEGTELTETQFWTLVGGLLGGLAFISLMIYCIRKERRRIKDIMIRV